MPIPLLSTSGITGTGYYYRCNEIDYPLPLTIHSISFWLNALIPRDIGGATTMLRHGEYRGLTALSASPCYLTDQRNFSNDLWASSRMQSWVKVDLSDAEPVLAQQHRCDDLIECDLLSGEVLNKQRIGASKMTFSLEATTPTILIQMDCRYGDSIPLAGHGIGETEYKGTIEIDPAARSIDLDMMICLFPAFEGYAAINNGPSAILFRHAPPAGILSLGPPLGAKRRIRSQLDYDFGNRSNDEQSSNDV